MPRQTASPGAALTPCRPGALAVAAATGAATRRRSTATPGPRVGEARIHIHGARRSSSSKPLRREGWANLLVPPLLPVLQLARLPAVLDCLAPAARVELDAHAFAQYAAVGASIRSQGRTLLCWWCHSQRCLEHGFNLWHGMSWLVSRVQNGWILYLPGSYL